MKSIDAKGNSDSVGYTDNFSNTGNNIGTFAFATSMSTPVPDAAGTYASNTALTVATKYDYDSGKAVSFTDANNQITTMDYAGDLLDRPKQVNGLALYGTTFAYDGWTIPRIAKLSFLLPLAMRLGIGRKQRFMEKPPYGIKCERVRQRIAGSMLAGDSEAGGLPGNPWPSLAEFYRLSSRVRKQLDQVRAPCLVVHSANDDVASVRNAQIVERSVGADVETLLLHNSYHMVTVDQEHREVVARSADFFSRCIGAHADDASGASSVLRAV